MRYNSNVANRRSIFASFAPASRWVILLAAAALAATACFAHPPLCVAPLSLPKPALQNSSNAQDKGPAQAKSGQNADAGQTDPGQTRLKIVVTGNTGKPVGNATVYVRFPEASGLFRHEKLSELDFKTNEDGSVKVPEIPQGKILVQVLAKGWHTFGKWYEIHTSEQTIEIKLELPPRWY
ncbi:MAG: carboxypeptidase-like regulatory domain-containing protein [Candidatus Acidiferrales bacterium]